MMTALRGVRREVRRLWRLSRLLWHLLGGALTAHIVINLLIKMRLDRDHRCQRYLVHRWMRKTCRILNLRVVTAGSVQNVPTMFVANHVSWLDIPCLLTAVDACFVSKDDVRRWPIVGRMAARVGTIFLGRGERRAASLAADRMTWALIQRRNIVIFPEGTTTDGRYVRRFHARLYQAAIRTHGHLQAVAISYPHADGTHPCAPFIGDDNLARHLWALLRQDVVTARLRFCPPVQAIGLERRDLAEKTRRQILDALRSPPHARANPGGNKEFIAV